MTWFGWDASNHDWGRGPMDVDAAVNDGITFFTHKATEGTTYQDPYLRQAMERARASKLVWFGTYFVPRTPGNNGNGSIAAQVDYYLKYLDAQIPWWRDEPRFRVHQVDTEHWGYDDVSPQTGAQSAVQVASYGAGRLVLHYAPRWSYGDSIPGTEPLWASAYGSNPQVPWRQAYPGDGSWPEPYSGRVPAIWQFGSRVTIGRQPTCDINAIKDPAIWAALSGDDDMAGEGPEILARVKEMEEMWLYGKDKRNALAYWLRTIVSETQLPALQGAMKALQDAADAEKVRDTASAAQLTALTASVQAMSDAIKSGGGSVDAAAILARVDQAVEDVKAKVEEVHQAEMAAAEARHSEELARVKATAEARVRDIQAQLEAATAELASASGASSTPSQPAAQ